MCVLNNLVLIVLAIMLKNKNFKSQFSILGFGGNESDYFWGKITIIFSIANFNLIHMYYHFIEL